jgi:hypothetical protein
MMMQAMLARVVLAGSCALAVAAVSLPAVAETGMAWDSVLKLSTDGSLPAPGNFSSDFQTASQTSTPPPQRGGLFGGITNAIGAANSALSAMRNGFAQRHYAAGSFVRSDDLASRTATIVDCRARTLTTLDLAKKTYRVTSLDAPVRTAPANGAERSPPGPAATDDGSKIAIKMTASALGPKTIDTVPTDGYAFNMTTTVTKPSGESESADMAMTSYFSSFAQPSEACGRGSAPPAAGVAGAPNMAMYQQVMRAMITPNGDPRITVSSSGPTPPSGRFPLYTSMAPKSNGRGGFGMVVENGNVRQISDGDQTIFGIPPDFTKIP